MCSKLIGTTGARSTPAEQAVVRLKTSAVVAAAATVSTAHLCL
jgi:hypothetical protein